MFLIRNNKYIFAPKVFVCDKKLIFLQLSTISYKSKQLSPKVTTSTYFYHKLPN